MESLPKLPGLDFTNRIKLRHHVSHCFDYRNGHKLPLQPRSGIGNEPLTEESIAFVEKDNAILYDPVLTYGRVKPDPVEPFRPYYVIYDKMTLTFFAFFKQSVTESPKESFRIRYVNVIYFLEDNSITVMEPVVKNCGLPQGRIVRRGKIPKNEYGEVYTWKDLNVGIDLELNGIVFHLYDCDAYTKDFLASQGVELNDIECAPFDPFTKEKQIQELSGQLMTKSPQNQKSDDDKLRRFLEFQGKVLCFDCILDETDRPNNEAITYQIFYYLEDDTVAIKELKENREGRDRFPMYLNRIKLPTNWQRRPVDFPSVFLERSAAEVDEYYQPKHFRIGETIFVFGRKFLLLNCDAFTRKYYAGVLKSPQPDKLMIKFPERTPKKMPIPDYLGLGTPEDSLASCYGLTPKPPKKNVIKYLVNANKNLRYLCRLDTAHPEDEIRKFILCFSLADDTIKINEPPIKNSGIWGGKFLAASRIKIPGCDPKTPIYYTPKDFYIGAILKINDHRFRITGCDLYVYRFMQEHPEYFSKESFVTVQKYLLLQGNLNDDIRAAINQDLASSSETLEKIKEEKPIERTDLERCVQQLHTDSHVDNPEGFVAMPKFDVSQKQTDKNEKCAYKIDPFATESIENDLQKILKES